MEEEEKKSNKKPAIIVVVYFIVIVILVGMIYSYLLEDSDRNNSTYHSPLWLEYKGTINTGLHKFDVVQIPHGRFQGGEYEIHYELHEVIIVVFTEINSKLIVFANDTINRTTLLDAKYNSYNSNSYDFISYFHIDSNDIITEGDYLTIYIDPSYPSGIYYIKFISINGASLFSSYFEIE